MKLYTYTVYMYTPTKQPKHTLTKLTQHAYTQTNIFSPKHMPKDNIDIQSYTKIRGCISSFFKCFVFSDYQITVVINQAPPIRCVFMNQPAWIAAIVCLQIKTPPPTTDILRQSTKCFGTTTNQNSPHTSR